MTTSAKRTQYHLVEESSDGRPAETIVESMNGRVPDVLLNAGMLVVPPLFLSALLLGLVFHFRVQPNDDFSAPWSQSQAQAHEDEGYYFVQLNSSFLIFIASWSSTLSPYLASCVVALWSYPAAARFAVASRTQSPERLATPYQLSLLIRMLDGGGVRSLWQWAKYIWYWRGRRQSQSRVLTSVVVVSIVASGFGFLVVVADTWLHLSTSTVEYVQTSELAGDRVPLYTFGLQRNCSVQEFSALGQPLGSDGECTVRWSGSGETILHGSMALQVLNNRSSTMAVSDHTTEDNSAFAYIGVSSGQDIQNVDFRASTYAIQPRCVPVSRKCRLDVYGAGAEWNCGKNSTDLSSFNGHLSRGLTMPSIGWFDNDNLTMFGGSGHPNSQYFGVAALANEQTGSPLITDPDVGPGESLDPEIAAAPHGGLGFVLWCMWTMYDLEYDWVNGSIARFDVSASNRSVSNLAVSGIRTMQTSDLFIQSAISVAAISNSAQELADKIALSFGFDVLSLFSVAMEPRASHAFARKSILVARLSKAALYSLVVSNLLFVLSGVILMVLVLRFCGEEVKSVQARLTITGLTADHFEETLRGEAVDEVEKLFVEHHGKQSTRVGIDVTRRGGYQYTKSIE